MIRSNAIYRLNMKTAPWCSFFFFLIIWCILLVILPGLHEYMLCRASFCTYDDNYLGYCEMCFSLARPFKIIVRRWHCLSTGFINGPMPCCDENKETTKME